MADKMLRIAGRGEDGTAKPFKTDDNGLAIIKNQTSKTFLHALATESGSGVVADVKDYNSITFQVTGSFKANVTFQASTTSDWWETIGVEDADGNKLSTVNTRGFYKADVSGYERIRAVVDWESGTNITIVSIATLASYSPEKNFVIPGQSKVVSTTVSDYHLGRHKVMYGENGVASRSTIKPINFENFSKRSVFIKNNLDRDVRISRYNKHLTSQESEIIEWVSTEINIPSNGGLGKLSYLQYPDLNEPYEALSIEVEALNGNPTSGELKIYWLGGVY